MGAFLDQAMAVKRVDYSATGNLQDLGASAPVAGHSFGTGNRSSAMVTQAGFRVGGSA